MMGAAQPSALMMKALVGYDGGCSAHCTYDEGPSPYFMMGAVQPIALMMKALRPTYGGGCAAHCT